MDISDLILRPIVSEKSMDNASKNKFTFRVSKKANKKGIRKAIEEKYKVNVLSICTNIVKGGKKRVGNRRQEIPEPSFKKAIVELKAGQKIDLFEAIK